MTFSEALHLLKEGRKATRLGWNGKGMFVYLVPANEYATITDIAKAEFGNSVKYNSYFAIKNTDGTVSTWVPSVNDCLAEDWEVII